MADPADQQAPIEPETKWVEYDYPLFYPTAVKFAVAGGLVILPLGLLLLTSHVFPFMYGASGANVGTGGWVGIVVAAGGFLLYLSGISQYACAYPLLTLILSYGIAYVIACFALGDRIRNHVLAIAIYLALLASIFKLISLVYLPPGCS